MSTSVQQRSRGRGRRCVVAHFMVGNTYSYTVDDWRQDIALASSQEIDGFALNVGAEDWQKARIEDCFEAARLVGDDFKLFFSFDMANIPGGDDSDIALLKHYIVRFGRHPYYLLYDGKALVSTFAGERSLFGRAGLNDAWTHVKAVLEQIVPIHFVPSFFIDPATYPQMTCMDGYFHWNGGWPTHLTSLSPPQEIELPRLDSDFHHLRCLGGRTFMAAVSPWFFTHYGRESWNKNWIYRGDDWLLMRRWEQLMLQRDQVDIVQIISWNDYGESHYIGPTRGTQPNSQKWVDGFPHEAWLVLNAFYARAFKDGRYPHPTEDRIFMWARPHAKHALAPDAIPRPDNWELTEDAIWVAVITVAPAQVVLAYPGEQGPPAHTFQAGYGVARFRYPAIPGKGMRGQIIRDGIVVAECAPAYKEFHVLEHPQVYNFNAYVAMS